MCFNTKERYEKNFKDLFAEADKRLVMEAIQKPKGSTMSFVELT
jgi:hypothetical protein